MSGTVSIPEDDIVSVGAPLPRIAEAVALDGRRVKVTFTTGICKVVDLEPALQSRHFYKPLRENDELFRSFRISEYGDAIEWDDGLDFSAVWLEALPIAEYSNAEFRQAMDEMGMSLNGMASALEISRRQVAAFRKDKPIPKLVVLATKYLEERLPKRNRRRKDEHRAAG